MNLGAFEFMDPENSASPASIFKCPDSSQAGCETCLVMINKRIEASKDQQANKPVSQRARDQDDWYGSVGGEEGANYESRN